MKVTVNLQSGFCLFAATQCQYAIFSDWEERMGMREREDSNRERLRVDGLHNTQVYVCSIGKVYYTTTPEVRLAREKGGKTSVPSGREGGIESESGDHR